MMNFAYQVVLLGAKDARRRGVITKLNRSFAELGLNSGNYQILQDADSSKRDRKAATAAVFFGFDGAVNQKWPELEKDTCCGVSCCPAPMKNLPWVCMAR